MINYGGLFINHEFEEIIVPALWEQQTFIDKAGPEIINQMWAFNDKGNRSVCLIPEVTALIQEKWRNEWSKTNSCKRIFYVSRAYRYEKPQEGRYREFTQFGVEILGKYRGFPNGERHDAISNLKSCLDTLKLQYEFKESVKRGLSYYVEDGFEVECPLLGAQKQVAGGGKYAEGIGWAIGVERLLLALEKQKLVEKLKE